MNESKPEWPENAQAIIKCDGCDAVAPMVFYKGGDRNFHKPDHWYMRSDEDGCQVACSRECIRRVSDSTGKTSTVIPI